MKKHVASYLVSATLAALLPLAAQAGFVDLEPESYAGGADGKGAVNPAKNRKEASGTDGPGGAVGFATEMPLHIALRQILDSAGAKFELVIPDGLREVKVSWTADGSWPKVLEKALEPAGLVADIRWSENKIYLAAKKPPVPEVAPPTFDIRKADNFVSTTLDRWAKDAGWQLVWDTDVDLVVDADSEYSGSFEVAVETLFGELSLSKVPLKATLFEGNKVIRVGRYEGANK